MAMLDSAKRMVESAFTRSSEAVAKRRTKKASEKTKTDALTDVKTRFELSRGSRRQSEGQWAIALSFMRPDGQWLRWREGNLEDVRNAETLDAYQSYPIYQSMIIRAAARAVARRPDVNILPKTDRELDKRAAEEFEALMGHYDSTLESQDTLRRISTYALAATTGFLKIYWDASKRAEVPVEWDEATGEPVRYEFREVGDPTEEFVPGHEVYLDPDATDADRSAWVMHVRRVRTEEINSRYGVKVSSDWSDMTQVQRVRNLVQTTFLRVPTSEDGRTTLYEMYERPCGEYPSGRTIVCTDTEMLVCEDSLPDGVVPFIPLGWIEDPFSPYDLSIGANLVPLQSQLNGHVSQQSLIASLQKAWLTRQGADSAGADLTERVTDKGWFIEVNHGTAEVAPTLHVPQMSTSNLSEVIDRLIGFMSDASGIHDVSGGPAAPGGSGNSGVAIRMMQDADQQLMSLFHTRVEKFCRARAIRRGLLCQNHVLEQRVWSLDPTGNREKASVVVSDLSAMRQGGLAAVQVTPGSGTPQLPEMQDQEVLGLVGAGVLDPTVALKVMTSPVATRAQRLMEEARDEAERAQAISAAMGLQMGEQSMAGGQPGQRFAGDAMPPQSAPPMPPAGMPPQ